MPIAPGHREQIAYRVHTQSLGARCELPTGEVVEVSGQETPFHALCRELEALGWGVLMRIATMSASGYKQTCGEVRQRVRF